MLDGPRYVLVATDGRYGSPDGELCRHDNYLEILRVAEASVKPWLIIADRITGEMVYCKVAGTLTEVAMQILREHADEA